MQGVTVLARCKMLEGFEGKNVATLTEDDCRQLRLSKSLTRGVLEEECSEMLSAFFQKLRQKKKEKTVQKKNEKERME